MRKYARLQERGEASTALARPIRALTHSLGTRMLEKLFKLREHGTTVKTELIAGLTTFLTMSYIIFVNPDILSSTGMDRSAVFVATCLAAALGSLVMALIANWPIGMAPGMGLNAFFAFTVVKTMGYTWEQALGAVFISGVIFLFLTFSGIRVWLIKGIPHSLRSAIAPASGCSWPSSRSAAPASWPPIRRPRSRWATSPAPARCSPSWASSSSRRWTRCACAAPS